MQPVPHAPGAIPVPPIPPPPPWQPAAQAASGGEDFVLAAHQAQHHDTWQLDCLRKELAATREELAAMRALLDDLPGIFEKRFASRIQPLLSQRQRLLGETEQLREQLRGLQLPGRPSTLPALMPAIPLEQRIDERERLAQAPDSRPRNVEILAEQGIDQPLVAERPIRSHVRRSA